MHKRIFITGGTGFVGTYLVSELTRKGHELTCLVREKKGGSLEAIGATLLLGDLKDIDSWKEKLRDYDVFIHAGGIVGEFKIPWEEYLSVNVIATREIYRCAVRQGVELFVFLSSAGVHGTAPRILPVNENSSYDPDCMYHRSKVLAELGILKQCDGKVGTVILRPTTVYGPRDRRFLYRMLWLMKKGFFPLFGDGRNKIHLLSVFGLIDFVTLIIEKPTNRHQILILADSSPVELIGLVRLMSKTLGTEPRALYLPEDITRSLLVYYDRFLAPLMSTQSLAMSHNIISSSRYYEIDRAIGYGYSPRRTADEVRRTVEWYLESGWL